MKRFVLSLRALRDAVADCLHQRQKLYYARWYGPASPAYFFKWATSQIKSDNPYLPLFRLAHVREVTKTPQAKRESDAWTVYLKLYNFLTILMTKLVGKRLKNSEAGDSLTTRFRP